jgi:organic radical activating enzyme
MTTQETGAGSLLVAELFGPTFQGEGPSAGQQAMFVRLSRCNLHCPPCDTPYTWDTTRFDLREHSRRIPVDDIVRWVLGAEPDLVVVTGGEPLLQLPGATALAVALHAAGRRVEFETNGTVVPPPELVAVTDRFNVSPKVASFAASHDRPIDPGALAGLAAGGRAAFKFVVSDVADFDEIAVLVDRFGLAPVWVMPAATTSAAMVAGLRLVAEETLRRGWHLSSRLHVLVWEDERGR